MLERFRPSRVLALVAALLALGATHLASALQTRSSNTPRAEVEITYPMPRVVVGDVFAITFGITNASTIEEPRVPSVPGLRSQVRQTHGSSFEGTLNGRKIRQSSVGFDVLFVAEQPGTYELPRARIVVDGLTYESKPFTVEVLGFDTSSSVRAELIASPQSPVVGQNLSIRLRVWLKPFRTGRLGFGVDQQWNHSIKARESRWGIFQGAAEQYYRDLRWRIPPRVERDEDGGEWYVYELEASASADRPGPLDLGEIELRVGVQRANGGERQFSIVPTPPPIVVEPVPTEGRPADFTGAVGDFEFEARVKPSRAGVGDPMTLTLVVVDRTPGGADLARLLPPSLVEQPELARSFRVPDEPLAGTVSGRTKVFTQTIRPLSERVTDVPALSFSFFDPAEREFRTAMSKPIPVTILPAERVDASSLPGVAAATGPATPESSLTEVEGGLVASLPVSSSMLAVDRLTIGPGLVAVLALPPLLAGLAVAWRHRAERAAGDERRRRALKSSTVASKRLRSASEAPAILAAIRGYLADRSGLAAASLARREAVALVREHGASDELCESLDRLLASGEQAAYAHREAESLEQLRARAREVLQQLRQLDIPLAPEAMR